MSVRYLRYLYDPASVALVGASERLGSLGEALARNLLAGDFKGEVFFVNRRHRQVRDRPAYRRLADLPGTPELAVIATPVRTIPRLLLEAGRCGIKAVMIATPYNFRGSDETAVLRGALRKAARSYSLSILGPGGELISPRRGFNASLVPQAPLPGHLALLSQSSAALSPIIEWANTQGIGFSHIVTLGGQIDIDIADLLDRLIDDADTHVILLVLETVEHVRPFLSAARAAARVKPVLVVRAGRGHDAVSRQADAVYEAAFHRAGVLRLPSLPDLCWVGATLVFDTPIAGDRLAIVGNSRLLGLLAADTLLVEGGHLARFSQETANALRRLSPVAIKPQNPLDLGDDAGVERYVAVVEILLREGDADCVLVLHSPNVRVSAEDTAVALAETVSRWDERGGSRPGVLACWLGAASARAARQHRHARHIPTYDTPDEAVRAFMQCWRRQQNRIGLMATPAWLPEPASAGLNAARQRIDALSAAGRDVLDGSEAGALLDAYGISMSLPGFKPVGRPLMLSLRMVEDALFGPVLLLASAERDARWADGATVALPPLDPTLAREAIRHSRLYHRLCEADAALPGVLDSVILLLVKVSRLIVDFGEVVELELNPILLSTDGASVEAARIRLAATGFPPHERLAIRPYPRELEETVSLPDGSVLLIRPVRPEDEPAFVASFKQLSTEEVRMRFMRTVTELIHEEAARLTQIDYERDMALVVFRQRPDRPLESCGVARLMRDADGERAEFAIVLLRAATGIGLGSLLLRRLIRYAKERGFRELFGEILRENEPMLALFRAMGFSIAVCPDDAGVMVARLPLT
ncbi:MAG: GNAT family N-acetyltransferase [Candidatus Competibacter sp.]